MSPLSDSALAQLAGVDARRIKQLVRLAILSPEQDGGFRSSDVQVVRIVEALEQAGISAEQVGQLIRTGGFSFRLTELAFPEPPMLSSKTFEQAAAELGIPFELVRRRYTAAGLPQPDPGEAVRTDDLEALQTTAMVYRALREDENATIEPSRHLGENLRRIAESQVRFFRTHLEQPLLDSGMTYAEFLDTIAEFSAQFIPASIRTLNWLYRRHFEHYIMQEIVETAEAALESSGMASPRPARPPAIAFLDLTGYTSLTERQGDEAAADLATRLTDVVGEVSRGHGGHPVKFLGDGVMFYFPDPSRAVLSALDLVDQIGRLGLPPARVGLTAGTVVFRDGDYFGRTVNTAARITDYARPGEVLVSDELMSVASPHRVSFQPVGPASLKGVAHPTTLHRAVRAER